MDYSTKFKINNVVCFKDTEGGVMQGQIIGLQITQGFDDETVPSDYELRSRMVGVPTITYLVLVQTTTSGRRGVMRRVLEQRTALTFEEAWKLA